MKKKFVSSLIVAIVILTLVVLPASAVQFGQPDGDGHPYVGLVVFYADAAATQPLWRCTGTLISPTVLLTAGHCAEDFSTKRAQVWFDSTVARPPYPLSGGILGTPISNPGWTGSLTVPNTHDVGVVILDTPVTDRGFGRLPEAGFLDSLATQRGLQDVSFTVVGYGLQSVKPVESGLRERFIGQTHLINLRSALTDGFNLQMSSNPGNWSGGTCFGDSGGPVFWADTNIVVAVNSFVLNLNCRGSGFGFRMDTSTARDFLGNYVTLP